MGDDEELSVSFPGGLPVPVAVHLLDDEACALQRGAELAVELEVFESRRVIISDPRQSGDPYFGRPARRGLVARIVNALRALAAAQAPGWGC